jgi:hypothetical protein
MLSIHEAYDLLEKDPHFIEWRKGNQDSYLCHFLAMVDEDAWHVGFYNPDDTIATFSISPTALSQEKSDEIFKKPDAKVRELNMAEVDLTATKALEVAKKFSEEKYPQDPISKHLIILQALEVGTIYNITFITLAMSTINIKVDAATAEIKEHKKNSLADMMSQG